MARRPARAHSIGGSVNDTQKLAAEIFARIMAGRALTGYQTMNPEQLAAEVRLAYAQAEAFTKVMTEVS
jgi:hypothetical protein